jgi:hypothetical protein
VKKTADCKKCMHVLRYVSMGFCGTGGDACLICKTKNQNIDGKCDGYEQDLSGNVYNEFGAIVKSI